MGTGGCLLNWKDGMYVWEAPYWLAGFEAVNNLGCSLTYTWNFQFNLIKRKCTLFFRFGVAVSSKV